MGNSSSEFLKFLGMMSGPSEEEKMGLMEMKEARKEMAINRREVISEKNERDRVAILREAAKRRGYEKRNLSAGRCGKCGELLVSMRRHDFRTCSCEGAYVDGGWNHGRFGGSVFPAFVEAWFNKFNHIFVVIEAYEERDDAIQFDGFPALDSQRKDK